MFDWPVNIKMPPMYNMARHGESHLRKQSRDICKQLYNVISKLPGLNLDLGIEGLDFGAGVGRVAIPMHAELGYPQNAIDIDDKCTEYINSTLVGIKASTIKQADALPYEANCFDIVISVSVFTHFDQKLEAYYLKEIARVLKPGGYALLTVSSEKALESRKKKGMIDWLETTPGDLASKGHIYKPKPSRVDPTHGYTLHSEQYIIDTWSDYINVQSIKKSYIDNIQDLVVCSK